MIITIDKSRELTRKEYIDFLKQTKGETTSEARISQLVSAGKLKVRDYPELNGIQLIVLNDDEQVLAQARFNTTQAIHTYSYKELGLMFGKLIHDLTNENGNAKTLMAEKQQQVEKYQALLQQTELERDGAIQLVDEQVQSLGQLQKENQRLQTESTQRQEQIEILKMEAAQQRDVIADLQRKLELETGFRKEFDAFTKLIMGVIDARKELGPKKATQRRTPRKNQDKNGNS